jgi:3D (Asp-Asp-Asp) domain-containing protein
MKKNIVILILIFLIIVLAFTFFIRENLHVLELNKVNQLRLDKARSFDVALTGFIVNYYKLWKHYQIFSLDYKKQEILLTKLEVQNEINGKNKFIIRAWETYEVTAYSPLECGTVTSIGIDLKQRWTRYFNVAAVDPKIIPYGSILLIDFGGEVKTYLAADCGGAIKGKKIDLFFMDVDDAINFGRQKLQVQVIK